jgi:hypothetical protein
MKKGITIRFSEERHKQITDYARQCEETIASLIRRIVHNYLSENTIKNKKG